MKSLPKTLYIFFLAYTLLLGGCKESEVQSIPPIKSSPVADEAKPKRETPEVLIDTTLQALGRIEIAYHPATLKLWIRSWEKGDTISGSTDWVFLKDLLPSPIKPVWAFVSSIKTRWNTLT